MSKVLVELKDVSFSYADKIVLENINLTIKKGDFWVVIGPNGGGKTTLLKLIVGILKPTRGMVVKHVDDEKIGYLPQRSHINQFPLTVLDAVLMGSVSSKHVGFSFSKEEKRRAKEVLKLVDMEDLIDVPFKQLSGGQQQRVLIARALISDPDLLLLDEPISNIDPQSRFCFYDFVSGLTQKVTVVMVSHDLSLTITKKVTHIACVNRWIITKEGSSITKQMYELMYGIHTSHSCPFVRQIEKDPKGIIFPH